ncbi:MAG: hypothetical protein WC073_00145 [Sterolibacterium sp.]|jgi:type I restriction-modification system DNA methylase subunit
MNTSALVKKLWNYCNVLRECKVPTLRRLPTGSFYAQGVKANVLFFDKKPASETPWTRKLWGYDLRTKAALEQFRLIAGYMGTAGV